MRNNFADVIYEEGLKDERICVVVADISPAGSIEKFRKKFPKRFINCGVAEQSMIGIAAGLALEGFRPFCYTIATFALYRPFEMIRVDLAYQNLPVTVVGMGAGVIYSTLGSTHHSMEDISIATAIPNMRVLCPSDPLEMKMATKWCARKSKGPVYMRLGKAGEPILTKGSHQKFSIDKVRCIKKGVGNKFALITYGTTLKMALELSDKIKKNKNFDLEVYTCNSIKPFDYDGVKKILKRFERVIILEENVPHGGLASRVKEVNSDNNSLSKIYSFTLKDKFIHCYGSYADILNSHGLNIETIYRSIFK